MYLTQQTAHLSLYLHCLHCRNNTNFQLISTMTCELTAYQACRVCKKNWKNNGTKWPKILGPKMFIIKREHIFINHETIGFSNILIFTKLQYYILRLNTKLGYRNIANTDYIVDTRLCYQNKLCLQNEWKCFHLPLTKYFSHLTVSLYFYTALINYI